VTIATTHANAEKLLETERPDFPGSIKIVGWGGLSDHQRLRRDMVFRKAAFNNTPDYALNVILSTML